jgi:hypothetical protein
METVLLNTRYALECHERGLLEGAQLLDESIPISCVGSVRELKRRIDHIPQASKPIIIAVDDKRKRNTSPEWRCQVWGKPFPPRSIYRLPEKDVCVASPAFCYLQMAARLSLANAIRLGMELCGTHSTLPFAPDLKPDFVLASRDIKNGFVARPALLSANELRS